jgi:hypothetical protein
LAAAIVSFILLHRAAKRARNSPEPTPASAEGAQAPAGTNTAYAVAKHVLREKEVVLAVVKDGKVIASGPSSLSHAELVSRQLGGQLPKGARVVTVVKENGVITVLNSRGAHGNTLPAPQDATDAIRGFFE